MESVIRFLVTKACLDKTEDVSFAADEAAVEIIIVQGPGNGSQILSILESFITDNSIPMDVKNQACKLLATLAPFLEDTSHKKLQ